MLNYQVSLAGQTFGPGTDVGLLSITGLRDLPPLRTNSVPRGGQDGHFAGFNYLDARSIVLTFDVSVTAGAGGPEAALQSLSAAFGNIADPNTVSTTPGQYMANQLNAAFAPPPSVLLVQLPNRPYPLACFGRATKYQINVDHDYNFNHYIATAEFVVDGGALYDNVVQSATALVPTATAGMSFPASFPVSFGSTSGGVVSLTNAGNYQTWPYLFIHGPCTNPTVTLNSTGAQLGVKVTLGAYDALFVDMYAGTVLYNTGALRNSLITPGSNFFALPPGASSLSFTTSDATTTTGYMEAYFLSAYSAV